jgi:hypothetical protein
MPGFFKVNTSQSNQSKAGGSTVKTITSLVASDGRTNKCRLCSGDHLTYQCSNLTETKDIGERIKKVKSKNFLKTTHQVGNCDSTFSCRYCRKRHHSLLHDPARHQPLISKPDGLDKSISNVEASTNKSDAQVSVNCVSQMNKSKQVFLSTAIVNLQDKNGNFVPCRALLDSGSESCFMTERGLQLLQLNRNKVHIRVLGVSQSPITVKCAVEANVKSRYNDYETKLTFLVVPGIATNIPNRSVEMPTECRVV